MDNPKMELTPPTTAIPMACSLLLTTRRLGIPQSPSTPSQTANEVQHNLD
jgi:hypothetical protein